jgi:hypothetical protein
MMRAPQIGASDEPGGTPIEASITAEAAQVSRVRGLILMTTGTHGRSRLARKLSWLVVASMTTVALAAPGAALVSAAEPVAVYTSDVTTSLAGNPTCNTVEVTYGGGQDWNEFKLEGADLGNGTTTDGSMTVTITNFDNSLPTRGFTWSSNFGVDAVIIKTGNGGEGYNTLAVYAPTANSTEATGGSLTTESATGISHISFCWDSTNPVVTPSPSPTPTPTPTPEVTPTPTPEVTPTPTPEVTPTPTPEVTPTPTPEVTPTPTPEVTPTPTPEVTPTPTPTGSVGGATGTPEITPSPTGSVGGATGTPGTTLPPTDTIGAAGTGSTGEAWRLIVLAMAGMLAAALLLTPAKAVVRNDRRR